MRAIILAAGVARRLGGQAPERPKCLLDFGERTLLERYFDSLNAVGVRECVVVVGHLAAQIEAVAAAAPPPLVVRCQRNPDYRKGAILSLWTAREHFDDDLLIVDADVFFPTELLRRLVESPQRNCFLMDRRSAATGEEQMLMATNGRVLDIARRPRGEYDTLGESVGFLKLAREHVGTLRELLAAEIAAGRDTLEHEDVYPGLMQRCWIGYETVEDLGWTEIDFPEDVERVRRELLGEPEGQTQA